MANIQQQADKQRQAAKHSLSRLFQVPEGYSNGTVEQFVDYIISAAVLEVAAAQQAAAQRQQGSEDEK